ncbi:MAG: DnaA/Hda family protein [Thermoguttaceae bacterium]|nr:DnaA/Hda family protein [Thermoguttaceae bacterium]MDW8038890.1 DnaA/Hda family protein [Thermoguttaceae bacterium]
MAIPVIETGNTGVLKIPLRNSFGELGISQTSWNLPYFLVGPENPLVEPAVRAVLTGKPACYFPVVFYGPSGTGKTHLAYGLTEAWKRSGNPGPVVIETAQDFHRQLTDALESQALPEFLDRRVRAKLWILEDLDRLAGKTASQIQCAQLLEHLANQRIPHVVTCRTIPGGIPGLIPTLQSRLTQGLLVNLSLPSEQTRRCFLQELIQTRELQCTPEAIELLVSRQTGSLLQLRKALMELSVLRATRHGIQLQTVQSYLGQPKDIAQAIRKILHHTAKQFAVRIRDIRGPSRKKQVAYARGVSVYLARQILRLSFQQIGLFLGNRDHTTILHSYQRTKKLLAHDPAISHIVDRLYETLNSLNVFQRCKTCRKS